MNTMNALADIRLLIADLAQHCDKMRAQIRHEKAFAAR